MSSYQFFCVLCLIFRCFHIIHTQRKEDIYFFFSQVHPFKNGIAHLFRTKKYWYGKQVLPPSGSWTHRHDNRYPIGYTFAPRIFFRTPLLYMVLMEARSVGAITPNNSTSSGSLIQMLATLSGMIMLPDSSIIMIHLFIFIPLICC